MVPPPETSQASLSPDLQPSTFSDTAPLLRFDRDLPHLFHRVASNRPPGMDGKALVDGVPLRDVRQIAYDYSEAESSPGFDAADFFVANFKLPRYEPPVIDGQGEVPLKDYVRVMWDVLTHHSPQNEGTLIGTRNPNLKPGERFGEGCYWDLDLGLRGLLAEARQSEPADRRAKERIALGVADNLVQQIQTFGYIPNGWRSYYLGRSQPPVFASIVEALDEYFNDESQPELERAPNIIEDYLPYLTQEYEWWMGGERAVLMPDGSVLNRHWDDNDTPRPESYQEDLATAALAPDVDPRIIYRQLRAAAESGKDFTARYLKDPYRLETIHTTDFITPELNSFLYQYETLIAKAHARAGRSVKAREFDDRAEARKQAMNRYLWEDGQGIYSDYDFVAGQVSPIKSMGMAYPVALGASTAERASRVATVLGRDMLRRGGFVSALVKSREQWDTNADVENGWAPDQIKGIQAALAAGGEHDKLAYWAVFRWLKRNNEVYERLGCLVEKNDVGETEGRPGGGGEYPVQRGFLWTNGADRILKSFIRGKAAFL